MSLQQRRSDLARGLDVLTDRDPDMARVLAEIGPPEPRVSEPDFAGLLKIVVGQQVSTASAAAIWERLSAAGPVSAERFATLDDPELGRVGFSRAKMRYGRAIAAAVLEGRLDLPGLAGRNADQVMASLLALPGIGRWSAEIFRMFALGDADVFPAGDLALREGIRLLRGWPDRPDVTAADTEAAAWRPQRSAASLVLWRLYRHRRGIAVLGADQPGSD